MKHLLKIPLFCLLASSLSGRTWTDSLGRTFEGNLVSKDKISVVLDIGGLQRKIAINQLSEKDRIFLSGGRLPTASQAPSSRAHRKTSRPTQLQANTGIEVVRLRSEPERKRWTYGSPNFEFICNEDLGYTVVREFAWMFESVWQFLAIQPYRLPRVQSQQNVRMKTYLVKTQADYARLGGPPGTAGVYKPSLDVIIVPFASLGITQTSGRYRINDLDNHHTLRHEVTHQLMHGQTHQAGWFIEGAAEYAATVPYKNTASLLTHHPKAIVEFVTAVGWNKQEGYNLGRNLTLPRLETFMIPDYASFQSHQNAYPYALLLYHFFLNLDGDQKGTGLVNYVAALQDGEPEPAARRHLLAGRSYETLEKEMKEAWNQFGLRLTFQ